MLGVERQPVHVSFLARILAPAKVRWESDEARPGVAWRVVTASGLASQRLQGKCDSCRQHEANGASRTHCTRRKQPRLQAEMASMASVVSS